MLLKISQIVLALLVAVSFTACTNDDEVTATTYQGAGSKWSAAFSGGNFAITHFANVTDTTPDMTVNGTYVDYSTGFRLLTVTSATGSGAPSAGAQAYGFEVTGFAFFLKPVGSDGEPIVMIESGGCPSTNFNGNWIIASFDPTVNLNTTQDSFGSASFTMNGSSSTATINQLNAENAGSLGSQSISFDYTTCSNGVLTFSPTVGETVDMFFTSSGGALVHSYNGTTHDSIIFAAPKHTAAVTQADLAGTYSVLVFNSSNPTNKLFPAKFVIPTSGAASANKIDDITNDTLSSDPTIQIDTFTSVAASPGLFTASIENGSNDGRMSCTFIPVGTTKLIACNGYGQNSVRTEPFFFLGKSR
ncbi:hypothetical protein K2X05_01615 [bacterium]|nr:hypothetical protein [bacterium]